MPPDWNYLNSALPADISNVLTYVRFYIPNTQVILNYIISAMLGQAERIYPQARIFLNKDIRKVVHV
jgi:hypothetical protein